MADLNRERIIELLDRLGSEDDAKVVAAARALHKEVTEAGLGWDALLTPERGEEPEYENEYDDDDEDEDDSGDEDGDDSGDEDEGDSGDEDENEAEPEIEVDAGAFAGKVSDARDAESLALIEKMLARRQLAETTREELAAYKEDIAEGELDEADRKYLRALHARISKRR